MNYKTLFFAIFIWAPFGGLRYSKPCNPPPAAAACYGGPLRFRRAAARPVQAPPPVCRSTRLSRVKKNPRVGTHGGQPFQPLNQPRCAEVIGLPPAKASQTAFDQRRNTFPIHRKRPTAKSIPCEAASAAAVCPLPAVPQRRPYGVRGGGKAPVAAAFWSSFVGLASRRQPRGERYAARYAGNTFAAGGFGGVFLIYILTPPHIYGLSRSAHALSHKPPN